MDSVAEDSVSNLGLGHPMGTGHTAGVRLVRIVFRAPCRVLKEVWQLDVKTCRLTCLAFWSYSEGEDNLLNGNQF